MPKKILVVPRDKLFEVVPYFNGFKPCSTEEAIKIVTLISGYGLWLPRPFYNESEIEQNPYYKQLIPYGIITTRKKGKDRFLLYQRGAERATLE